MGPKRFIDKKNSVSFHLLHRSQRDPLAADESAPQRVLAEAEPSPGDEQLSQRQLSAKYGVYFDDDYNYLQHIKSADKREVIWVRDEVETKRRKCAGLAPRSSEPVAGPSLQLPSSVFASHVEEKVGLLNRAAPDHGLPGAAEVELGQVMDDDYAHDPYNELEDNFIELAGGMPSDDEDGTDKEDIEFEIDEELDSDQFDDNDLYEHKYGHQAKSVFTEYSTTSQGVLSTVAMEALNERFENFMGQYEDLEVGGLESEEIAGPLNPNSDRLMQLANEFEKAKEKPTFEKEVALRKVPVDEEGDDMVYITVHENTKDRMDCESILSTYSNNRNLPQLIDAPNPRSKIKINNKGMVQDDKPRLTKKALAQLGKGTEGDEQDSDISGGSEASFGNETLASRISMLSVRPWGEASDEKKARKHELKALRRERIQEKKANQFLAKVLTERQLQSQSDKLKAKQAIQYS